MESDELETPETFRETDLASSAEPEKRVAHLRRLAVWADSHSSLPGATRRLRRQLPGDDQFGDPLSTAGAQPAEAPAARRL